jgi:tRNA A-37 threonylcarbamoyl transferase component Bud32
MNETRAAQSENCAIVRDGRLWIRYNRAFAPDAVLAVLHNDCGAITPRGATSAMPVHVKALTGITLWQNVKNLFQRARGRRAFDALRTFATLGLPAPEAIALIEERSWGMLRASYLLTREIENAENLAQYLHRTHTAPVLRGEAPDPRRLHRFMRVFAPAVRAVHDAGVEHRDMKGENILIAEEGGAPVVRFIDFDSLYFSRRVSFYRVAKNLAQLASSLPGCFPMRARLRFFALYVRTSPFEDRRKELLRATAALAKKRIDRRFGLWRRGRPEEVRR